MAGIDPGLDGAIAIYDTASKGKPWSTYPMPVVELKGGKRKKREVESFQLMQRFATWEDECCCHDSGCKYPQYDHIVPGRFDLVVVEDVHSFSKQGVVSMFSFGRAFESALTVLKCLKLPYQLVTPQAWKKVILRGFGNKSDKSASVVYVQRKYPKVNLLRTPKCRTPDHGIADAVCLAEYGLHLLRDNYEIEEE